MLYTRIRRTNHNYEKKLGLVKQTCTRETILVAEQNPARNEKKRKGKSTDSLVKKYA